MFGGPPAFDDDLHVGRPNLGNRSRLMERFNAMLDRRWLTNSGPYEREFETRIAELIGVKHCIATCNATVALEILIRAAGLRGEVIVPSFTFIATAHALRWQEITPVFCDIDRSTHNIDPDCVERLITPGTTGIIGVHVWGRPCPTTALSELANRYKLRLLFDAAHAFGCTNGGQMVGNFGDAEVFSFHATKFINSLEGGAVVTNNDELARKVRLMKNFGFSGSVPSVSGQPGSGYDEVVYLGTNGKMTEAAAAMGLTSLESLDEIVQANLGNYHRYQQQLETIPGVTLVSFDQAERNNYQYVVVVVDPEKSRLPREILVELLHAERVLARRYFFPGCHQSEPYQTLFPDAGRLLPETEWLAARVMTLPTGTAVGSDEIDRLCDLIRFAVTHADEISSRLRSAVA